MLDAQVVESKAIGYDTNSDEIESSQNQSSQQASVGPLEVYPNPVHARVIIQIDNHDETSIIQVLNFSSNILREEIVQGKSSHTLNLYELEDGMYILRLINSSGVKTTAILKQ